MLRDRNGFLSLLLVVIALVFGRAAGAGELSASAVTVDITPEIGVPLAGYGGKDRHKLDTLDRYEYATYLQPSIGILDPVLAKILVLRRDGKLLAFIAADLIGGSAIMQEELTARLLPLGFSREGIFLSGTHTHAGPGTFAKNWIFELIAADMYQPRVYERLVLELLSGVRAAVMSLRPATLSAFSFEAEGLQMNRRGHPGHFDPVANVLLIRDGIGDVIGGIANLAVHGTSLPAANLMFSADTPGAMRSELERSLGAMNSRYRNPAILFINGAEGDVAPAQEGVAGMHALGSSFAEQAMEHLAEARPIEPKWKIRQAMVRLGKPGFGLKACLNGQFPILQILGQGIMPLASTVFPKQAEATVLELGDMLMMTWPGEPTTSIGLALRKLAADAGAAQGWVLGLTNDHLAYFVMPEEYEEGGYETCSSLYGPQGAVKLIEGYRGLLSRRE
jgi:neutral ceramidase